MEKQCEKCGVSLLSSTYICQDCHQEILREEEQRRRATEENYDVEYGDYKY